MRESTATPNRVREYRLAADLSIAELARLAGVQRVTVYRAEAGHVSTKVETYRKLAAALGCSAADLMAPLLGTVAA